MAGGAGTNLTGSSAVLWSWGPRFTRVPVRPLRPLRLHCILRVQTLAVNVAWVSTRGFGIK